MQFNQGEPNEQQYGTETQRTDGYLEPINPYTGGKIYPEHQSWVKRHKNRLFPVLFATLLVAAILGARVASSSLNTQQPLKQAYFQNSGACTSSASQPGGPTAKLPKSQFQETVADMNPGESEYTVPWALEVFSNGNAYLDTSSAVFNSPGGTIQMEVIRTDSGYEVVLNPDYKYNITPNTTNMCGLVPVKINS